MSIKSDRWIARMAREHGMIEPFEPRQVRDAQGAKIVSYGVSSYGYDVRCASDFKIFTNINTTIVDPKRFDERNFVDFKGDCCIIPPNSFALAHTVEYFRVPENVLILCVGKSTYARCFRGNTRVALVDGTAPTLEEMARRHEDGEIFFGYSIGPLGRIIVTLLEAPRLVGRDALLRVTLDDGATIDATPDHRFLTRDGRLTAAHALRPGDSLMPLYRSPQRGYEMVYQPLNGHLYPTHRLADEWNLRHGIYGDAPGTHRHHVDFDRRNNVPPNIARLPAHEHIRLHNDVSYGDNFDAEEHGAAIRHALGRLAAFRGAAPQRNHKVAAIQALPGVHDVYCLTVPEAGNFALEAGVFVQNCGLIVNVTPLEPGWEGQVTLEFSNTTPLPAKIYANEGVAQMLFLESDEVCETSYRDRAGKYMGQRGVTLPKA